MVGLALLAIAGIAVLGPIVAVMGWMRTSSLERRLEALEHEVAWLHGQGGLATAGGIVTPLPMPAAVPPAAPAPVAARPDVEAPPIPPFEPPPPAAVRPRPPAPPPGGTSDFATELGPRILIATGALAFMVFLGLFVKYAWDNDWVGPAGRVLTGATIGLALLALGLRLLRREYRPLGQGLAAAGLAGLYTSAFAAHAVYGLVGREPAGMFMVAVTVSAVLLAVRLDTRLLAGLAWTGAYLTPLLLSTGQDHAVALFLFLALVDAGALIVDRRKPWPETLPLAFMGTAALGLGWYARFFRPERFTVAALAVAGFTALFVFGMARKERRAGMSLVVLSAGIALLALATLDRPLPLLLMSVALAAAAALLGTRWGAGLAVAGVVAAALPYCAWAVVYYRADAFAVAASWVVAMVLAALLPRIAGPTDGAPGAGTGPPAEMLAFVFGSIAAIPLCALQERPIPVLALLLALAGIAVALRRRSEWAELAGVLLAALAMAAWLSRHFAPERFAEAFLVALPVLGLFLVAALVRSFARREPITPSDAATHLAVASVLWAITYHVLDAAWPALLGPAALALAATYLAIGLAARAAKDAERRLVRLALGLAAAFVTIAVPVQLGLHGITLGWAAEGVLLVWLGQRFGSRLARAAGYAVLALAVLRLFVMHLPLHPQPFTPVFNPAFGTWLAVVAALAVTLLVTRGASGGTATDAGARWWLGATALVLLFALFTGETRSAFDWQAALAARRGDAEAAQTARRSGGLAVSVLWTLFATSLLAAGLALRSRAVFYAAYALFAATAFKVVVWDLETFSMPYRMLSFLALGLLLLAGAYLNLRFRARLVRAEAD